MISRMSYKPAQFFLIAYLITWAAWFAAAYFSYQEGMEGFESLLMIAGLSGPAIATLVMFRRAKNPDLWRDYRDRLVSIRRIDWRTLPIILFLFPAAEVLAICISLLFGYSPDQFTVVLQLGASAGFLPFVVILILAPALEEAGWRGYGMDSLRSRSTLVVATLWFAILWAFWHLPLFFINHYYHHEILSDWILVANFFVSVFAMAFMVNWLYERNNRSVIACFLFHLSSDLAIGSIQAEEYTKCITTVVLVAIAVVIVFFDRKMFLEKGS
jgi:membrane protease YdiL (CAAX protease family)